MFIKIENFNFQYQLLYWLNIILKTFLQLNNQLEVLQNASATNDTNCSKLMKEVEKYRNQLADIVEAQHKVVQRKQNKYNFCNEYYWNMQIS